jgi:hypothetical protein
MMTGQWVHRDTARPDLDGLRSGWRHEEECRDEKDRGKKS